jgi:hypothetical protein
LGLKRIIQNGRGSGRARPGLWGYPRLASSQVQLEQGSGAIGLAWEKWVMALGRCEKRRLDEGGKSRLAVKNWIKRAKGI